MGITLLDCLRHWLTLISVTLSVFVGIFATLVPAFGLLAGAYWNLALGNTVVAGKCQIAAGAITFVTDMLGWWIFFAILLASLDFPFQLPGMSSS